MNNNSGARLLKSSSRFEEEEWFVWRFIYEEDLMHFLSMSMSLTNSRGT